MNKIRYACNQNREFKTTFKQMEGDKMKHKTSNWYLVLLKNYPIRTKAITSALLCATGDIIAQVSFEESIDIVRVCRMSFLGGVLVGPTLHYWCVYIHPHV